MGTGSLPVGTMAAALAILTVLLFPLPAWAFGPVAHVDLGLLVIAESAALSSALFAILRKHPRNFLEGTLGPDREVAKNLAPYDRHSHNWDRAFEQFRHAPDDPQRAFFLGCLCHLAADVVSHNYFVPLKVVESHRARMAGHLYWEMRFDARASRRGRAWALRMLDIHTREHRRFLATVVPGNLLGPRFNVRVTGLAMRLQSALAFQKASVLVDRESRLALHDEDVEELRRLALSSQLDVLRHMERSRIVQVDARGSVAIAHAVRLRGHLRDLVRRKGEPNPEAAGLVRAARGEFRKRIHDALGA